jgi:hypothetical protein
MGGEPIHPVYGKSKLGADYEAKVKLPSAIIRQVNQTRHIYVRPFMPWEEVKVTSTLSPEAVLYLRKAAENCHITKTGYRVCRRESLLYTETQRATVFLQAVKQS